MEPPMAVLIRLMLGPIVWALHLAIVYGAHTAICTIRPFGTPEPSVAVTAAGATFVALLALLLAGMAPGTAVPFRRNVGLLLMALSAIAIAWLGITAAIVPACTAP
jgi:hypothetical protein